MNNNSFNPMSKIFKHLAISILFMFIGFMFGKMFLPVEFVYIANKIILIFSVFLLILAIFSKKQIIPRSFPMIFVYIFTFIDGVIMYPILNYYLLDLGTEFFIGILLSTTLLFTVLSMISSKSNAGHFLPMGKILFVGLIVSLLLTIFNIFIGSNIISMGLSILGLVVFSGYVLYDVSLINYEIMYGNLNTTNDLSIHVLNLYLDFINILLDMLNIASKIND